MPPQDQTLALILSHVQNQGQEINEIKTALVTLARVEERQSSQRDVLARLGSEIDSVKIRVGKVEMVTGNRGVVFHWLERIGLVAAGGVVMKLINHLPGGGGS